MGIIQILQARNEKDAKVSKMRVRVISESEFTVQGHGVHTAFVELVESLKTLPDVDVIINKAGRCDVTHIHTVGGFALWHLLFSSGKKVVSAHIVPDSLVGSLVGAKHWLPLARVYLRWFYNRADLVIAVSDETKRDLESIGVRRRIEVLHNTIDTTKYKRAPGDREKARTELGLPAHGMIVIGAGQIQPRKRVDMFVEAAVLLPEMTFVWVGGMPFKRAAADHGKMDKLVKNPPKNVIFPGMLPLDKMHEYYHAADIFMLPSDQETFGLVVVEAAASDLPVVLRDIPDYDETFRDFSVMVPSGEFAPALKKLAEDEVYYDTMVRSSRRMAERFDSREGAKRLVELYETL
jgi:1,2-diacylglycerol-3-alpha-glucose alpha-1,2-galactosyltransferase